MKFSELQNFFYELGAQVSPSTLHGFVSGRISCGPIGIDRLVEISIECMALSQEMASKNESQFRDIILNFLKEIEHTGFVFIPILPEEDIPLSERLIALGEWCGNYVSGFAEGVEKGFQLTDDANEALEDLASIARISIEFDEDGECDYIELVEYVRIAVQLVYMDVNATKKLTH